MTNFIIARHGHSEYNRSGTFTGQTDVALTELGIKQAELTAAYVCAEYKIDAVYSSDLSRAVNTAQPIADRLGLQIVKDSRLREIFGGLWENNKISELPELYPEDYSLYRAVPGLARCTGGESFSELQTRALEGMLDIASANDGKTVFVATHGGTLRALTSLWMGYPLERLHETPRSSNASITEVVYREGEFKVTRYALEDHLGEYATEKQKHWQ